MQVRPKDLGRSQRHVATGLQPRPGLRPPPEAGKARAERKKKGSRGRRNERRGQIRNRKGIELRPAEVDRKERFGELADAAVAALRPLKKLGVLHTITSDNGKEFARHEKIARELGVEFFFARPYRSCDRGANENMNGLVRQYLPKGTDFGNVTPEDVRKIEERLNNRPRKRLDYMTPKEYILHKFNILLR